MAPAIRVERNAEIVVGALDNPGKLNALTLAMWGELAACVRALSEDDSLRCIVLRGAGNEAFAAGAPLVARWHKQYVQRLLPAAPPLTEAEIDANFDSLDTADYRIGRNAFLAKTKPKFVGR